MNELQKQVNDLYRLYKEMNERTRKEIDRLHNQHVCLVLILKRNANAAKNHLDTLGK